MADPDRAQPVSIHDLYTKQPIQGLAIPTHDYIGVNTSGSTTDVYTFRKNTASLTGVSGTLVATITITYSDSTKATISSVQKT